MNDEPVYRTALATPGLLKKMQLAMSGFTAKVAAI